MGKRKKWIIAGAAVVFCVLAAVFLYPFKTPLQKDFHAFRVSREGEETEGYLIRVEAELVKHLLSREQARGSVTIVSPDGSSEQTFTLNDGFTYRLDAYDVVELDTKYYELTGGVLGGSLYLSKDWEMAMLIVSAAEDDLLQAERYGEENLRWVLIGCDHPDYDASEVKETAFSWVQAWIEAWFFEKAR